MYVGEDIILPLYYGKEQRSPSEREALFYPHLRYCENIIDTIEKPLPTKEVSVRPTESANPLTRRFAPITAPHNTKRQRKTSAVSLWDEFLMFYFVALPNLASSPITRRALSVQAVATIPETVSHVTFRLLCIMRLTCYFE